MRWSCLALFTCMVFVVQFRVDGHSWIACTDYREQNGEYWKSDNCRAFPRDASKYKLRDGVFGQDRGFDNRPSSNNPCKTPRNDGGAYDDTHPMATYYHGQNVVIAHPAKNHVAESCTNKNIPDSGNFIYTSPRDVQSDPTLETFRANEIADLGISPVGSDAATDVYPKPGYQNAPKFCENMDKALATNVFEVPTLTPGRYTFMWAWNFNGLGDADLYTTCWEVNIVATKEERNADYQARGIPTWDIVDVSSGGTGGGEGPVTGSWSQWSAWSACSVTCGNGQQRRSRSCTSTGNGGQQCEGSAEETMSCNSGACPSTGGNNKVDGNWSDWSSWSACSVTCGDGRKTRRRQCNNPAAENGGNQCEGESEQSTTCNDKACPGTGGGSGGSGSTGTLDIKATFTDSCAQSAIGQILMPTPRPQGKYHVIVSFPCNPARVHFWNAQDVSSDAQRKIGVYVLDQPDAWMRQEREIGFSMVYGTKCAKFQASTILTYIVKC